MGDTRTQHVNEALDWEEPYDVVLALHALVCEQVDAGVDFGALSLGEQLVCYVLQLCSQVVNGGFAQYLSNTELLPWRETLEALRRVGACEAACIMREAVAIFPDGTPAADRDARIEQLASAGERATERLQELTWEFYKHEADVYASVAEYCREHKDDFM